MRNGDRSGRLCSEKKKKVTRSAPREKNFGGRCKGCACTNPYRGVATEVGRGTERGRQNTGDSENWALDLKIWISVTTYINNIFIAVGYKVVWLWFSWKKWKREHTVDWFWRSKHSLPFGLLRLQFSVASTRKVTNTYTYSKYRGKLYCAIKLVLYSSINYRSWKF